ncbi:Gfo/Idh/MocA family oxidoreductase [Streptomyces sp. NBC_01275]|uniref:Gfo/Idh/MocA family protein n=1 Tax=Streptomyces sp. NBC_01275 TaxID=2903807 RepID=UPI00224FA5D7|nr:Gfo/Idh/MocA family oxidoreductase [Streptomyces sp. NBC_01275]MCX4767126.1 Gfo/Idh/MocA family oxidoreductase [Streptomyces sp. NBC_01275]
MRIGLLGTGPWAHMVYAPVLSAHDGLDLVGVWGRRPQAAKELAEAHGAQAYDDVDALLADVDAVAVALPPDVQADLAVRAARAGCHLLLDKPVATKPAGARAVVQAVAEARVASVVFFTTRFLSDTGAWIDRQADAGGWFTAHAQWLGSVFADSGDSPFATPWRAEKGALWDVGPHALSVLLPILGDVRRVSAAARGRGGTVHLVLDHAGGASSTLTLSLTAPSAASGADLEIRGEAGTFRLPESSEDAATALGRAADALIATARSGRPHPCDAAFGLRVTEILADAEALLPADAD